jgi:3-oxoadipate enol-lactonase
MVLGHKLHGSGAEGVFLYNDWLADSSSWLPTLPYLDTKTFTYSLTDLRGYGRSMNLKGEYNEREAAADTVALADHLGWKKFHLAGFSMTGMVVEVITDDDKCRELASRITGHRLSPQWQEAKLRLARDTRTREAARGYLDMWTLHNFSGECGKNNVPFLVLGCKWDQPKFLEDDLRSTFLKWHPRAELIMMDCGHCPMQEMPVYLQTLMEKFMKRHCD